MTGIKIALINPIYNKEIFLTLYKYKNPLLIKKIKNKKIPLQTYP